MHTKLFKSLLKHFEVCLGSILRTKLGFNVSVDLFAIISFILKILFISNHDFFDLINIIQHLVNRG